jgi:heme/copper-type cytochrome/quinol oxidase subunit 3
MGRQAKKKKKEEEEAATGSELKLPSFLFSVFCLFVCLFLHFVFYSKF